MHRKFIATVVAAALAVTAFGPTPARADRDLIKTLAVIAGAAVVGKIIYDQQTRKTTDRFVTRELYQQPTVRQPLQPLQQVKRPVARPYTTIPYVEQGYQITPRPLPVRAERHLLPGDCLQSVETRDGRMRYFAQNCLERSYNYASRLPQDCFVRFRTYHGPRQGYEARCLRDAGYQLARR
jgi:hypothetical protein